MTPDPTTSYRRLAARLDALPNGFPPSPDGVELRLLAKLFTPEEADLASQLSQSLETPAQVAARTGGDPDEMRKQLKSMSRRGLILAGPVEAGLGFALLPFVVGIYEMQVNTIDAELASLFEQYYRQAFGAVLAVQPPVHRVIPVNESIRTDLEVRPFESAAEIIASCRAWGVMDCICRKQKKLIGQACSHPVEMCMLMSSTPGAFDRAGHVRVLTQEQAMVTLRQAAEAGLVHSVSNNQKDIWYICNCCTCSCGVLRGLVDLGLANVVARSSYRCEVDQDICLLCGACLDRCQFRALVLDTTLWVDLQRCAGCGVCTLACLEGALHLVPRPEEEVTSPPLDETVWKEARLKSRNLNRD
ncbi:MAG: 4Fe-4S ferredoxin [Chloroflexota bacterium]|nr:MAG: 4Fe-4S ferredoxin [Chloroflexota bacterium]